TIKSKVAQYNPDNNKIEMVTPIDIVWQKYEGGMINIKSMSTDQLVTPNHRVISYTEAGRVVIDLAEDIKPLEGRHFKTGGVLEDGNDLIRIQDDFIRLIIATQADGHLNKDCSAITFTFVRPDKTLRLKKILNSLGFKYSEKVFHRKGRPETSIRVMSSEDTKSIRSWLTVDKQFTSKLLTLPISQRELVIDELKYWDGTVKRNGDIVIDQVGRGSIDI